MKLVIQRVKSASVTFDETVKNEIGHGLLLFVAVEDADGEFDLDYAVRKVTQLRIFSDATGKMNQSVQDISGEILSISQFTLYAEMRKGNRPSFSAAGEPHFAQKMYERLNQKLAERLPTKTGKFAADMQVQLINDGPVTLILDTKEARK